MRKFTKSWRYFILIFGISLLSLSACEHKKLNSSDAIDVRSFGVVVSKHMVPKKFGSYTKPPNYRLSVIYKIDPKLNTTPEVTQLSKDKHLKMLNGTGEIDYAEFKRLSKNHAVLNQYEIGELRHAFIRVSSQIYEQTQLNTDIPLIYRSDRPWKPSWTLSGARLLIPYGIIGGLLLILWASIGFLFRMKDTSNLK